MSDASEHNPFLREAEALRDLRALEAIEADPSVSQRQLAQILGVAVGVANACVRTLVRKGLVKIRGENNRTITYHLTHQGVLQKSMLAMQWTRNTLDFYRQARRDVATHLTELAEAGIESAVLLGARELAEIVAVVAPESGIRLVGVIDPDGSALGSVLAGVPVRSVEDVASQSPGALVVCTDDLDPELVFETARRLGDVPVISFAGRIYEEAT